MYIKSCILNIKYGQIGCDFVVLWHNLGFQEGQKLDAGNIWTDRDV